MENFDINNEILKLNQITVEIFDLIKSQKWDNLVNLIKSNDVDYNIKDTSNMYLLEYLILFNKIEIIKLLLDKNVRIDIIDDSNRSILYNTIKFSYIDILKLLLEHNKISIGKNILEVKDNNENISLFYAIKFFNLNCVEIIINYTTNFFIKNIDGDNALHLAIKSQNYELFKIIFNNFKDLKSKNNQGENYIHLIVKYKCYDMFELMNNKYFDKNNKNGNNFIEILNSTEYKYNFTILHYICINLDYDLIKILETHKLIIYINGNCQDNSGNIFYHYFINNIINIKNISVEQTNIIVTMNEILKKIIFNINLYNIDGDTPSHVFFNNINFFTNNNLNSLINYIVDKSDLNIQNFKGESVFFIIVKNNFWKNIKNILITKKIDIFIIIENSETIFDYVNNNDLVEFIDIITKSYLYQLKNSTNSIKWLDYWDNRCKKNINLSELNETEIDIIKNFNINLNDTKNNNICYEIIFNKIKKFITLFIKNKNRYESNSYPISYKLIKFIKNYPTVILSTFTGSTIDVLCGLIYLNNKFNSIKPEFLLTSINIINKNDQLVKCDIIGSTSNKKICEIYGFEITWKNKILYFPHSKQNDILKELTFMIKNKNYNFYVIPIGIEIIINNNIYSQANYLIFDLKLMEVERFEPHGSNHPVGLDYDVELFDSMLENKINSFNLKFKYIIPINFLPKIGFQVKEINELNSDYLGDPNGFCALWCIWWADIRLSNPDISRIKLVKLLNRELINNNYSYKKLIRDYSHYVTIIRDNLFIKANTNINEWINDTISDKNINQLNNVLLEEINNLE